MSNWQEDVRAKNVTTSAESFWHDFELFAVDQYQITYPVARQGRAPIVLSESIGGVQLNSDNTFDEAKVLRLTFDLRQDAFYAAYR